jgi:hypothetical protein
MRVNAPGRGVDLKFRLEAWRQEQARKPSFLK